MGSTVVAEKVAAGIHAVDTEVRGLAQTLVSLPVVKAAGEKLCTCVSDPVHSTWCLADWWLDFPNMEEPEFLLIHIWIWYVAIPSIFASILCTSMSYAFVASFIFSQILYRVGNVLEMGYFPQLQTWRSTDSWSKMLLHLVHSTVNKVSPAKKND